MSSRFKLLKVQPSEAEEAANALSQMIEYGQLKSFQQTNVSGSICFALEYAECALQCY